MTSQTPALPKLKSDPDPDPVFHKFLTPGPKEKRRILPESTLALWIRFHLRYSSNM